MGKRFSDAYNINKQDIGGKVKKQTKNHLCEWWIYKEKESRFVDSVGKNMKMNELYLYCIIVTEEGNEGIRQQNDKFIALAGIKLTDDEEGKDLSLYLSRRNK